MCQMQFNLVSSVYSRKDGTVPHKNLNYEWTITKHKISNINSYKLLLDMKLKLSQL